MRRRSALLGAAAALLGARHLLVVVTVHGGSMAPTYAPGRRLLVVRLPRVTFPGAVVVFAPEPNADRILEHRLLVKRVIAVAGQPVPVDMCTPVLAQARHVPRGHLLVRGDNTRSLDSRQLGFVRLSTVLGVVFPLRAAPGRSGATASPRTRAAADHTLASTLISGPAAPFARTAARSGVQDLGRAGGATPRRHGTATSN